VVLNSPFGGAAPFLVQRAETLPAFGINLGDGQCDASESEVKNQAALTAAPLMNARMSALITSACVVIMPWGKPG
jgi:hypothetical protein